jgi:hypothetical protein
MTIILVNMARDFLPHPLMPQTAKGTHRPEPLLAARKDPRWFNLYQRHDVPGELALWLFTFLRKCVNTPSASTT